MDFVADCLTRIRNGQRAGHKSVVVRGSKLVHSLLEVFQREGLISGFSEVSGNQGAVSANAAKKNEAKKSKAKQAQGRQINVVLKYFENGEPLLRVIDRVSRSGRRRYVGYQDLPKMASGLGVYVLSTSRGVMSDREARNGKVGGEILARLF